MLIILLLIYIMEVKYKQHIDAGSLLNFVRPDGSIGSFNSDLFTDAIIEFEKILAVFQNNQIPIGDILGLRNLSGFVGEVFNRACANVSSNFLKNNPHQDGYPDLLVMDNIGKNLFDSLKSRLKEKEPFSPFKSGGIEVKATCGDLRAASWFTKKDIEKPMIGDERNEFVTGYNWKAHHRETNNLLGLIWDFINNKPTIIAMMYSSDLNPNDWGNVVKPKAGSRTTSVSIMNKNGVNKMYSGLILSLDNTTYISKVIARLSKY